MTTTKMLDDPCLAPDCKDRASTTLVASAETLRGLGFTSTDESLRVRVCTKHYLLAMAEAMRRAGVPKEEPPKVDYWCEVCGQIIPASEVGFGGHGASPRHVRRRTPSVGVAVEETHAVTVRIKKAGAK